MIEARSGKNAEYRNSRGKYALSGESLLSVQDFVKNKDLTPFAHSFAPFALGFVTLKEVAFCI